MVAYFTWAPRLTVLLLVIAAAAGEGGSALGLGPDELHMPLGLLALVANLFAHSHFLSWMLQTGFDIGLTARGRVDEGDWVAKAAALKRRALPATVAASLLSVLAGILGMGTRALAVPAGVHGAAAMALLVASGIAARVEGTVAVENQGLLDALGLDGTGELPGGDRSGEGDGSA